MRVASVVLVQMRRPEMIGSDRTISLQAIVDLLWPKGCENLQGWTDELSTHCAGTEIHGLSLDSRSASVGDAFFALPGASADGAQFVVQAFDAGAVAAFVQVPSNSELPTFELHAGVALIRVPRLLARLSEIAGYFYGEPSAALTAIGVTGTNGKTSIACMIADSLAQLQGSAGLVGTLGFGVVRAADTERVPLAETGFTTPDAIQAQRCLAEIASAGCQSVVMEVSSHALAQYRVDGVPFSIAVLSNLSRDHLDFHGSMESYALAKRRLFEFDSVTSAVLNYDDAFARRFLPQVSEGIEVLTYSTSNRSASVSASNISYSLQGCAADIHYAGQQGRLVSSFLGEFYLSNSLAVIAVLLLMGYPLPQVLENFAGLHAIPGRMQRVRLSDSADISESGSDQSLDINVVVDYAHTPDALKLALSALRQHCNGQLVCVFGCGGNRDVGKRAEMGAIAEQSADRVYITSDNPRTEEPQLIASDILQGIDCREDVVVELDRARAIGRAIAEAQPGALVLVAGKGHEQVQLVGRERRPFSDYAVAQAELQRRCAA